jgi:hypothetical protein
MRLPSPRSLSHVVLFSVGDSHPRFRYVPRSSPIRPGQSVGIVRGSIPAASASRKAGEGPRNTAFERKGRAEVPRSAQPSGICGDPELRSVGAPRVYMEATVDRARIPRSDVRRDVMDRGGRDTLMGRVPDLAPGWGRACTARGSSGTVWLALSALVFLLVHLPFDKAALSEHCVDPANSDKACHPAWWLISLGVFPLLMVVAAVLAFREAGGVWRLGRLRH